MNFLGLKTVLEYLTNFSHVCVLKVHSLFPLSSVKFFKISVCTSCAKGKTVSIDCSVSRPEEQPWDLGLWTVLKNSQRVRDHVAQRQEQAKSHGMRRPWKSRRAGAASPLHQKEEHKAKHLYQFHLAAVTNYCKAADIKQYKLTNLQLWRLEV